MSCLWCIEVLQEGGVNEISRHVITAKYIRDPIISLYMVLLTAVSRVGEMEGESGVKSAPGSMSVMAGQAMSILK